MNITTAATIPRSHDSKHLAWGEFVSERADVGLLSIYRRELPH